jgi:hypothetical protein
MLPPFSGHGVLGWYGTSGDDRRDGLVAGSAAPTSAPVC